jgi:hypothetical protein
LIPQHVNIAEDLLDLPNDLAMFEESKKSIRLLVRKIKNRRSIWGNRFREKKDLFFNFIRQNNVQLSAH